ncbi:hypothetical protein Tco_0666843, partial [Tanacetum coccineum]
SEYYCFNMEYAPAIGHQLAPFTVSRNLAHQLALFSVSRNLAHSSFTKPNRKALSIMTMESSRGHARSDGELIDNSNYRFVKIFMLSIGRKTTLTIVGYWHDAAALSPEPEEGGISLVVFRVTNEQLAWVWKAKMEQQVKAVTISSLPSPGFMEPQVGLMRCHNESDPYPSGAAQSIAVQVFIRHKGKLTTSLPTGSSLASMMVVRDNIYMILQPDDNTAVLVFGDWDDSKVGSSLASMMVVRDKHKMDIAKSQMTTLLSKQGQKAYDEESQPRPRITSNDSTFYGERADAKKTGMEWCCAIQLLLAIPTMHAVNFIIDYMMEILKFSSALILVVGNLLPSATSVGLNQQNKSYYWNGRSNGWDTHTEAETDSETRRGYTSKFKTCQSSLADHLRHKLKG